MKRQKCVAVGSVTPRGKILPPERDEAPPACEDSDHKLTQSVSFCRSDEGIKRQLGHTTALQDKHPNLQAGLSHRRMTQ